MAFCEERSLLFISGACDDVFVYDIEVSYFLPNNEEQNSKSLQTSERVGNLEGHENWVYAVVYCNGYVWTASRDRSIRCWNVQVLLTTHECDAFSNHDFFDYFVILSCFFSPLVRLSNVKCFSCRYRKSKYFQIQSTGFPTICKL